jgi:protein involved in polysaccharide export with SLBB domain
MKRLAIVAICLLLLAVNLNFSQVKGFSPVNTENILQEEFSSKFNQQNIFDKSQMPLGDIIDPKYYYVGPGDILAIQNLTTSITTQFLTVTPENSVLIPRIGKISLKGLTLEKASEVIMNAFKERNSKAMIFTSLYKPRNVLVTLRGNIDVNGTFIIPASYRVSTAIAMLNQPKRDNIPSQMMGYMSLKKITQNYTDKQYNKSGIPIPLLYASRNVAVLHNDGTSSNVDIEEAAVTGNIELDPYVRENDIISVPEEPVAYPEISVSGSVIRPVRLPYKQNDNISKLLKFGYGFTDEADLNNITVNYKGGTSEIISLNDKFEVDKPDVTIEPGTSIIVAQKKNIFEISRIISVQGCVNKPGSFLLTGDSVRLYDIIDKAGGFTDDAYLPLAYILRNNKEFSNHQFPQWTIAENFQYSDLKLEDTTRFRIDVNFKKPVVSCDFISAFIDSNQKANILLHDGDIIVVPTNPKTVFVYGQVNNPGYITFQSGKTMEWYIEQAGGYALNAEDSRARIIDGRTKVWKAGDSGVFVHAGDEIYVPKPPDMPPGIKLQTWAIVASAVASIATLMSLVLTIININKN